MKYTFTTGAGTQSLTQAEAEALLVSSGHCDNPKDAKELLASGEDIEVPAHGKVPAGTLSWDN